MSDVCAIIVTRGNDPLDDVLAPYDELDLEVFVWDNSRRADLKVYGRYAAIQHVDAPVILVQDDDCVLPAESVLALLEAHQGGSVTCNMPERFRPHYPDSALVGFGAVFDRHLPELAFQQLARVDDMPSFHRECDTAFTMLTPRILVDVPVEILPSAHDPERLWKQRDHFAERERMRKLVRQVRDG